MCPDFFFFITITLFLNLSLYFLFLTKKLAILCATKMSFVVVRLLFTNFKSTFTKLISIFIKNCPDQVERVSIWRENDYRSMVMIISARSDDELFVKIIASLNGHQIKTSRGSFNTTK